jgi:hypothetical protein
LSLAWSRLSHKLHHLLRCHRYSMSDSVN